MINNLFAQAGSDEFDFDQIYNSGLAALKTDISIASRYLKIIESNSGQLTPLQKAKTNYYLRLKLIYSDNDAVKELENRMFAAPDSLSGTDAFIFSARRYLEKSMPDKAVPLLMQALDSLPPGSDKADLCIINLSEAYRQKQEYLKGIDMLNELLHTSKRVSEENKAYACNRMAALYNEWGNNEISHTDSVFKYSEICISISEKIQDIPNLAASQNELSYQYILKKQYPKALELSMSAISNFKSAGLKYNAMNALLNLSNIYIGMKQFDLAIRAADDATGLCRIEENRNLFMRIYLQFALLNELTRNFRDAYEFLTISDKLQVEFFKDRINNQINEQSARYELLIKEQKIKDEKQKNEFNQKQIFFLVVILVILSIAFVITFYYLKLRRKQFLNKKLIEAVIDTETNERKRIASDLHDGLGPVISAISNYFQAYIDANEPLKKSIGIKLQQVIAGAIDEVSRISHNISPHVLEKHGLNTALENFIAPLQSSNNIKVSFASDFSSRIELRKELTLYRCITELFHNTLKHAGATEITLRISGKENMLSILYGDNGKGFDVTIQNPGRMGLFNIKNRVETLGGKLSMESPGKGVLVNIEIPI